MRNQDGEIDSPRPALSKKRRGAVVIVIVDVAGQEQRGDDQGSHHASLMGCDLAVSNEEVT